MNPEKQPQSSLQKKDLGQRVIDSLGQPADLYRVLVRRLWDDHYRVNIFVGVDEFSSRIAHSFFLVTDGAGAIVRCAPEITRLY